MGGVVLSEMYTRLRRMEDEILRYNVYKAYIMMTGSP